MKNPIQPLFALAVLMCALGDPTYATENPLLGGAPPVGQPGVILGTGEIIVVDPDTLNCVQTTTFDDIAGGPAPGTNYDGIFNSIGVYFAERFVGQTLSFAGDFDVISGAPTNPLTLQVGSANQNLNVVIYVTQVLAGLGPLEFPDFSAIGEGSMAMYFSNAQSQFGFSLIGGDGGTATLSFYRADGSEIDTIVLSGLAEMAYGFQRAGGIADIAGVLIQTDDPGGIGLDDVCHDVEVVPVRATTWGQVKIVYR